MLQPKNLLPKRATLLSKEPRVDRKAFAIIGFPDFAFGISVVFSKYYLATVSESETVFLCSLNSTAAAQPIGFSAVGGGRQDFILYVLAS
jgi:hypothetical protein